MIELELTLEEQLYQVAISYAKHNPTLSSWDCATTAMNELFRRNAMGQENRDCPSLRLKLATWVDMYRNASN